MHLNLMAPVFPQLDVNIPEGWWKQDAQLDLDFANKRAYNKFTQFRGRPDSILTYTSPSPKLVYGDDGVLRYAPHNLALQSNTFDQSPWTLSNAALVSGQSDAFGGKKAWKLVGSVSASTSHIVRQSITLVSGFSYRWRVIAKAGEKSWLAVDDGLAINAYFNLSNGTVGSSAGATVSIVDLGNGWYECSVSFVASGTGAYMKYYAAHANGVASWVGDGVSGIYISQGHFSRFPVDTTYVETTSAAVYSLPIDHDPITLAPLGVLIEEQRTNLLTYSEQFDNAVWAPSGSSVLADQTTAPNGTTTADTLASTAASSQHLIALAAGPVVTSGTTYTGSIFLKKGVRATAPDWVQLTMSGGTFGAVQYANFNLNTGAVGAVGAGATATIQNVGNGWYRCSITAAATSTANGSLVVLFTNNNDALGRAPSYADATTSDVYLWGAQLEAGAFPTSYIPTVASQVTRAADQVSILTSAFAYNASEGTIAAEIHDGRTSGTVAVHTDGSVYDFLLQYTGPTIISGITRDGGVSQASLYKSKSGGPPNRAAFAYKADDFALSVDGQAVETDTSGTIPTMGTQPLRIGSFSTSALYLNGHIKRLTYFPTRKADAELQGLTI